MCEVLDSDWLKQTDLIICVWSHLQKRVQTHFTPSCWLCDIKMFVSERWLHPKFRNHGDIYNTDQTLEGNLFRNYSCSLCLSWIKNGLWNWRKPSQTLHTAWALGIYRRGFVNRSCQHKGNREETLTQVLLVLSRNLYHPRGAASKTQPSQRQ